MNKLFLIIIILVMSISVVDATWCDTDFAKRINVSVNNTAGSTLTDYQVYVNLSSNPINETSLRVYNATSCTFRSHWSENTTGGNSYGIWINYSSIAASSWTNDTAIYHNNSNVDSVSNGTSTFKFFDDFDWNPGWVPYSGNPVLTGAADPCVLYNTTGDNKYKIWYRIGSAGSYTISVRNSTDGLSWNAASSVTNGCLPSVEELNGSIYLFYNKNQTMDGIIHLCELTDDTTCVAKCGGNAILTANTSLPHESYGWVHNPAIWFNGTTYFMLYGSYNAAVTGEYINLATSTDMCTWTKDPNNPQLSTGCGKNGVDNPTIAQVNNTHFIVWFSARSDISGASDSIMCAALTTDFTNYDFDSVAHLTYNTSYVDDPTNVYRNDKTMMWYIPSQGGNIHEMEHEGNLEELIENPTTNKWTITDSPTLANSQIIMDTGTDMIIAKTAISNNNFIERWYGNISAETGTATSFSGTCNGAGYTYGTAIISQQTPNFYRLISDTWVDTVTLSIDANMHTYELVKVGSTSAKIYSDGVLEGTLTTGLNTDPKYMGFGRTNALCTATVALNWTLIRKYASPEPSTTLGSEEDQLGTTPLISNVQNGSISSISQYINWTVDQTAHNRVLYSNESDLTPVWYSTWDNSTAAPNITLSSLTASTQYWYQAWSYNTTNTSLSDNSSTLNFTTAAENTYIPPEPTTLANNTGNFWINHTWNNGTGNKTDSYNVSVNTTWYNTTTNEYYNNTGLSAHGWSNISIYGFNSTGTGTLSNGNVSQDTQVPNNAVTITNCSNKNVIETQNVYVDIDSTDTDGDTPTYSCNRTDLFTDFSTLSGKGNWSTDTLDNGTYYVDFGVSDGYSSTDNCTITIEVAEGTPTVPTNLNYALSNGNTTINWTWNDGSNTDKTNATLNTTAIGNITSPYEYTNNTLPRWENLSIRGYNSTTDEFSGWLNETVYVLAPTTPTLHIDNTINIKEDWGRDFNSNLSTNVTGANASDVWMNFTNAEFTNTSLGWVNLTLNEWVNESHNVNNPVANMSISVYSNSTTSGATNDTESFYYNITNRTNTATMDSFATQNVDTSETFYVNATCNEEYSDTFLGGANLSEDGAIVATDSSVTDYVNFSHSESSAGQYNYTIQFYNLTHYDNATTPTYSNVTVTATTLTCTQGDICVNITGWWRDNSNINTSSTPIQHAVDNATSSNIIYVWNGSYTENVDITTASLTLQGEGRDVVTLEGTVANDRAIYINNDYVNISGFNVSNATASPYAGIYINDRDHCNISYNTIHTCYYGINPSQSHYTILNDNIVHNCSDNGIYIWNSNHCTIKNNTIYNCTTAGTNGLWSRLGDNCIIKNNTVYNCFDGIDVRGDNSTISDCISHNNTNYGIVSYDTINNTFTNNSAHHNDDDGFYVYNVANSSFDLNVVRNNTPNGFNIHMSSTNCNFSNNSMYWNDGSGLYLDTSSNANNIFDNKIYDNNGSGIYISDVNNITITNNTIYDNSHGINCLASNDTTCILNSVDDTGTGGYDYYLQQNSLRTTIKNQTDMHYNISIIDTSVCTIEYSNSTIFKVDSVTKHVEYYNDISNLSLEDAAVYRIDIYNGTLTAGTTFLQNVSITTWAESGYNISVNSTNATEICIFTTDVANATDVYGCYVDGIWSEDNQAVAGVVTWTYLDGFSAHDLEIEWGAGGPSDYTPSDPINLQNTTGNFWGNHTWNNGAGNITNSYNVSVNLTWYNSTTNKYYNNTPLSAHKWSNINVWAYNTSGSGTLSNSNITQNTQIPNNVPILSGLPDNTTDEDVNQTDIFDLDDYFTDVDNDTPTYLVESNNQSSNVSVTINASNNVSYTLASGWNGTASVVINVTDGWSGEDNDTFLIVVNAAPLPGDYIPGDPTTLQNSTGNYWVNYTWNVGSGNITDSYNVSWNLTWYNTTMDTFMKKEVGASNWANITIYAYNSSGNGSLSAGSVSDNVQAPAYVPGDYIPPDPTTLQNTTGNYYVNYTWIMGVPSNITDSYNVSWNLTWYNTTLVTYMNDSVGEFGWANISVYAFNSSGSGTLSTNNVSDETQAGGGTYTTSMTTGVYNLVSYYNSSNSSAEQFGDDISNVDYVARHNNVNNTFTTHVMGMGSNNFTTIHGRGYFIYVNASGSSTYNRNNISDSSYYTNLSTGWDIIGWTNATSTNAEGLINSLGSACKYTSMLNVDGWSYTTHTSGFTINNHVVGKGKGYWVWVNTNTNWNRDS